MENEKKLGSGSAFPYGNMKEGFSNGMSQRLLLAGMAMQGLLANPKYFTGSSESFGNDVRTIPRDALIFADELLRQEKL